jgi:hypothetical protein
MTASNVHIYSATEFTNTDVSEILHRELKRLILKMMSQLKADMHKHLD